MTDKTTRAGEMAAPSHALPTPPPVVQGEGPRVFGKPLQASPRGALASTLTPFGTIIRLDADGQEVTDV